MNPFNTKVRDDELHELKYYIKSKNTLMPFKDKLIDVNTINLNRDDTIYRFFNFYDFLRTLKNKKLCHVRPHVWEDPFENFVLKSIAKLRDGRKVTLDNIKNNFYAQCWTLKEDCDGLWRNYKKPIAIKVKSNVHKLMNEFYDISNSIFYDTSYFIGKVEYLSNEKFDGYFDEKHSLYEQIEFIQMLLVKRTAFSYEEELRIIFNKPNSPSTDFSKVINKWDNSDQFFVKFNPNYLFEEIIVDPWVDEASFKDIKGIIKKFGYKGTIKRSNLYTEPNYELKVSDWI